REELATSRPGRHKKREITHPSKREGLESNRPTARSKCRTIAFRCRAFPHNRSSSAPTDAAGRICDSQTRRAGDGGSQGFDPTLPSPPPLSSAFFSQGRQHAHG